MHVEQEKCILLSNEFSPHEIMQLLDNRHPELRGVRVGDLLNLNLEGMARRLINLPWTLARTGYHSVRNLGEFANQERCKQLI